ncbi:aldolase/citrate lyase family protein [Bordetella genomosp. 1]|uniref:HpcH/HpaI aldolase/citrate lyase domain-containing protein n=1 Tax=Bordetella genomosp. 1 TaxID=1395607 RepID=A0ABX4F3D9_9BORD|nr:aldolase/citrate lyase family protein [Bordetella genomosp. 1]OZI68272.1 hypothetical protein CAL27_02020 [Bordetella genomosp. 1]
MNYMLITNLPEIARHVVLHGVKRVFVDLEILGKVARQGHLNTVISRHSLDDVQRIRAAIGQAELLVRINPLNEDTQQEIDDVIARGADIVMLPMFHDAAAVRRVAQLIDGRARLIPLVETVGGARALAEIMATPGVSGVHIGLNDLHLELGCDFMFEPLANGMMDELAAVARSSGLPFGMGGVARVGEGLLPAEVILGEHVRLGSTCAILSRTFHRNAGSLAELNAEMDFGNEISKLDQVEAGFLHAPPAVLEENRVRLVNIVNDIVAQKRAAVRGSAPAP